MPENPNETQDPETGFLTEQRGNPDRVKKELERRIQEDKELHPDRYNEDDDEGNGT